MSKKTVLKIVLGSIACLLVVLACVGGYNLYSRRAEADNHAKIAELISTGLTFENGTIDADQAALERWLRTSHVSDADVGHLYERLSNVYKFKGQTIDYYQSLAYAMYYLKKGGDMETAANLYADMANYYTVNYAFDRAQEMMNAIYEMVDITKMEDLQIKSYIYRMQAVLDYYSGRYTEALAKLTTSQELVNESLARTDMPFWEPSYTAINDVRTAQIYFEVGRYDEARAIVDSYRDSELFSMPYFAYIMARDFSIPYYEVACRLAATDLDRKTAEPLFYSFIECCNEYGFRKSELNTLLYLLDNYPPDKEEEVADLYRMVDEAYMYLTDIQTDEYTGLISEQVSKAIGEITVEDERQAERARWTGQMMVLGFIVVFFTVLLAVTYRQGTIDGLTKIRNRKAFNRQLAKLDRSRAPYGVMMMDIDNFKHVNDTYGHQAGDTVLQGLAGILRSVENNRIKCFRYGGEEFVMLSMNPDVEAIVAVGELIRKEFAKMQWDFGETITISLGVADQSETCDIVNAADQNLYYSKEHGKNTVTYCKDGTIYTTRT